MKRDVILESDWLDVTSQPRAVNVRDIVKSWKVNMRLGPVPYTYLPLSTRCANGWHLLPVLRLRDRSVTIGTAMVFKCPTFHSYFGWIFIALVDLYYCQWVMLTSWLSALSHYWARRGLWNLCPTITFFKPHSPFMWFTVYVSGVISIAAEVVVFLWRSAWIFWSNE